MIFKVCKGFGDDFIPIDETELEKAIYAQMTGKVAIFEEGTMAGNYISAIIPDYHASMGWNYGYKLQPEDWNYIRNDLPDYRNLIEDAKKRVEFLIRTKQERLIGKDVDLPELEKGKDKDLGELTGGLADKFKIK